MSWRELCINENGLFLWDGNGKVKYLHFYGAERIRTKFRKG